RPEQATLSAGLGRDGDGGRDEGLGDLLGLAALDGVALGAAAAHALGLRLGARGGLDGPTGREEQVAGVAVGHVDDLTLGADAVDVGVEDDAHQASTSSVSVSGVGTSASPSPAAPLGGGAVGRGIGPSGRRPRSPRSRPPPRCWVMRLVYGSSAISRAFLIAMATSACCWALLHVTRRARIWARSVTHRS